MTPAEFEKQFSQVFGPMLCDQEGCDLPASHRFTWPGRDEAGICGNHVGKLRAIAATMGLHIQIRPLQHEEANDGQRSV